MKSIHFNLKSVLFYTPYLLFFLFSFVYFGWFADHIFFYQEKSSLFLVSGDYLLLHLSQPGGFLKYLGELQNAFYYYPLLGALIVSMEMILSVVLIQRIGKNVSGKKQNFLSFVIGALLFYLQTNYQYAALNPIGIFCILLFVNFRMGDSHQKKEWIFVGLSWLIYWFFGLFAFFTIMLFTLNLFVNRSQNKLKKLIVLWMGVLLFFFLGKEFLFYQTTKTLLVFPFMIFKIGSQTRLFFTVLTALVLLPLFFKIKGIYLLSTKKIRWDEIATYLVLMGLGYFSISALEPKDREYFKVEKMFYTQKFDEIVAYNRQRPSTNILTNFLNNIALSQTGKLSGELFDFPQSVDGQTLFLKWELRGDVLKRGGYFYYYMGLANEAQRWAYEYMVMRGNTPEAVKMIAKTELINGNYRSAKKYIDILKQSVFYRGDARALGKLIFNDKEIDSHPELGRIKRLKPKQDFLVNSEHPYANLDLILNADSSNRIAMEYKLAGLLLQKDMSGIVAQLALMEKMGYSRIPKNVEEAVVADALLKGIMPQMEHLSIDKQTMDDFDRFYKMSQQNQSSRHLAQNALTPGFGNTYWYYVFFH